MWRRYSFHREKWNVWILRKGDAKTMRSSATPTDAGTEGWIEVSNDVSRSRCTWWPGKNQQLVRPNYFLIFQRTENFFVTSTVLEPLRRVSSRKGLKNLWKSLGPPSISNFWANMSLLLYICFVSYKMMSDHNLVRPFLREKKRNLKSSVAT